MNNNVLIIRFSQFRWFEVGKCESINFSFFFNDWIIYALLCSEKTINLYYYLHDVGSAVLFLSTHANGSDRLVIVN